MKCYAAAISIALLMSVGITRADPRTDCPGDVPCKVIILDQNEERILTTPNGILDTAQQGRPLDLGSLVTYFRAKIDKAPAGDVKTPEKPVDKK